MRELHRVLRPGGWCQMVEIYFNAQSDNGAVTDGKTVEGIMKQRILTPNCRPLPASMVAALYPKPRRLKQGPTSSTSA